LRAARRFATWEPMRLPDDVTRLDEALVARGLLPTRARARDAIRRGTVAVDGAVVDKPGARVRPASALTLDDPAAAYVSRAALKLVAGLDAFGFEPRGRTALDLGASTGSFTQVLIERGAAHVVAVEVGHSQMDTRLAGDPRVTLKEGLNARFLSAADLDGREIGAVVCDVSFISLTLALPPALALAAPGAFGVFLVKPQFEAGREAVGRGGRVAEEAGKAAAARLAAWLDGRDGWRSLGFVPSPILGAEGAREYLLGGVRDGTEAGRG